MRWSRALLLALNLAACAGLLLPAWLAGRYMGYHIPGNAAVFWGFIGFMIGGLWYDLERSRKKLNKKFDRILEYEDIAHDPIGDQMRATADRRLTWLKE